MPNKVWYLTRPNPGGAPPPPPQWNSVQDSEGSLTTNAVPCVSPPALGGPVGGITLRWDVEFYLYSDTPYGSVQKQLLGSGSYTRIFTDFNGGAIQRGSVYLTMSPNVAVPCAYTDRIGSFFTVTFLGGGSGSFNLSSPYGPPSFQMTAPMKVVSIFPSNYSPAGMLFSWHFRWLGGIYDFMSCSMGVWYGGTSYPTILGTDYIAASEVMRVKTASAGTLAIAGRTTAQMGSMPYPLRIKKGVIYGVELGSITDTSRTPLRIQTAGGVKSLLRI